MRRRTRSSKVTIIQPYVPSYRVALFETLAQLFAEVGLELQVAHPQPTGDQALRRDGAGGAWSVPLKSRRIPIGTRSLNIRNTHHLLGDSAVIVAELASTNLDTYRLLLQRRVPVVLWGHGKAYVTGPNRIDTWLELWMSRRAAHVITYTESGADHLTSHGIQPSKISVAWNSTDTASLRAELNAITDADIAQFQVDHGISPGRTAVFVGALDESKRIDLLLDAVPLIQKQIPDFGLVIAGTGPLTNLVRARAAKDPAIHLIPRADERALALLGKTTKVCIVPGRIGLVAVDALALGLPIVTTNWAFHGPERDYLEKSFSMVAEQSAQSVAAAAVRILNDDNLQTKMSTAARHAASKLSIQSMSSNMAVAIQTPLKPTTR